MRQREYNDTNSHTLASLDEAAAFEWSSRQFSYEFGQSQLSIIRLPSEIVDLGSNANLASATPSGLHKLCSTFSPFQHNKEESLEREDIYE